VAIWLTIFLVGQLGTAELGSQYLLGNSFVFIAMSLGIGFSRCYYTLVAEADACKVKWRRVKALLNTN